MLARRIHRFALAGALALAPARPAAAEQPAMAPGFLCLGESESVMRGTSTAEIERERDLRLAALEQGKVEPALVAHTHCVVAELMRRVGDARAAEHYQRAIELNPKEPAYELWYARYYQWSRGASSPVTESAEGHYYEALDKLEGQQGVTQAGSTDAVTREWTQRNLALLYQEDGLPLLPWQWKAFPYRRNATWAPQLTLSLVGSIARDTTDFWETSDTRRFTQELQTAVERRQAGGPRLTDAEIGGIARAPARWDTEARLRLRERVIGVIDGTYRRARLVDSQITDGSVPDQFNDVDVEEAGLHVRRVFPLYPAFDWMVDASYTLQKRTGVVEGFPDETEDIKIAQVSSTISRFLGPDKLTLGGTYVAFDIPDSPGGGLMSERQRAIRAAFVDYAIYRPMLLPQLDKGTLALERRMRRGWHWFAAGILDDEQFGRSVVKKQIFTGGTAFKGLGDYNLTLSGSYLSSDMEDNGSRDDDQSNSQWRTYVSVLRRIVDEEANPGVPGTIAAMSIVVPVRHDLALTGLTEYENVRAGVELWTKFFSSGLRGTSFLVNIGADYQYFYNIDKGLVSARLEARMGWPSFGNVPAF